jgi:tRNA(Ile)-lysidine synthase
MRVNRSILPSGRIGLAVSGGSDSVALAFLLTKGGKKKNASKRFVVLHVDHGLRPESKEEFRFVKALAKRLGVPFKGIHAKVERAKGESLEMAARRVRLEFFERQTRLLKLDAIATGHHMDDIAETFLMRIKRASGPVGLA